MVQLVVQPREPFESGFLRRPGTFFYARLKRLTKLLSYCFLGDSLSPLFLRKNTLKKVWQKCHRFATDLPQIRLGTL